MDIVSRLKKFISYLKIPVTQFADSCGIPRPTLSQLLNGRNKKVSDELISKIHEVYPSLSVLWLMFGEGDMLHQENIKISEPETRSIFDFSESEQTVSEPNTPSIDFKNNVDEISSEKFSVPKTEKNRDASQISEVEIRTKTTTPVEPEAKTDSSRTTISFNANQPKKIVNIIVYYSDNSFESFVPNQTK